MSGIGTVPIKIEEKIAKAKIIHKGKYNYDKVVFVKFDVKIIITCPIHGDFLQTIYAHVDCGGGCRACANEKVTKNATADPKEWVEKMSAKFPHLCFNDTIYVTSKIKCRVRCKKHGYFESVPNQISRAGGCWHCGRERAAKYSRENPALWPKKAWQERGSKSKNFDSFKVYILKCWDENESFYKIGRTFTSVKHRFRHKHMMPYNFEIIKEFVFEKSSDAYDRENELKRLNKNFKYVPLIKFGGMHECFSNISLD